MSHSIYVSGPIMAPDVDGGLPSRLTVERRKMKFNQVSKIIRDNVISTTYVINPLNIPACTPRMNKPVCAGLENGPFGKGHSWQCYLRHDLEVLVMCHEIVMLEGWENSPGANVEFNTAKALGLEISYWCDLHANAHSDGPCNNKVEGTRNV
jgi:hypothetical protein